MYRHHGMKSCYAIQPKEDVSVLLGSQVTAAVVRRGVFVKMQNIK